MKFFLSTTLFLLIACNVFSQVSDFTSIDFTKADKTALSFKGASLENLPLLAYQLTNELPTEVEKFRAIYTWVCQNIKGDQAQFSQVSRKRKKFQNDSVSFMKWNHQYKKKVFKKLVNKKKTMCTGYAYLVKELCNLVDIPCKIIDGYGRSVASNIKKLEIPNHSWNAVRLNNKWYLCDATWSSGYLDEYGVFVTSYNDGYFLTEPLFFAKNHFPLQQKWLLDDTIKVSSFVNAPLIYGEAFANDIQPVSPNKLDTSIPKNTEVVFSFKSSRKIKKDHIELVYYSGSEEKKIDIYNTQNKNNITSFTCTFKNKGRYDTHLRINGDIVATYSFSVDKS